MSSPIEDVSWATLTQNDGALGTPNKVEPSSPKKASGFGFPEKPSRSELNWWMNAVGKWVNYFNQALPSSGINLNFLQNSTTTTGLTFGLESGKLFLGTGSPISVPATTHVLPASVTRYLYLDLTQATPALIPTIANAWPSSNYIPLFVLITDGSSITSVTDYRTWAIQGGSGGGGANSVTTQEITGITGTAITGVVLTGLSDGVLNSGIYSGNNYWVYKNGIKLKDTDYALTVAGVSSSITVGASFTSIAGDKWDIVKLSPLSSLASLNETLNVSATQASGYTYALTTLPDNRALTVYINGVYQSDGWAATGSASVQFTTILYSGDKVDFVKNANAGDFFKGITATQPEVDAGVSAGKFVTPATLRFGVVYSLGSSGYLKLPSWLGGLIFQWGAISAGASSTAPATFPTPFTTVYRIVLSPELGSTVATTAVGWGGLSSSGFTYYNTHTGGAINSSYIAIGI